MFCSALEAHGRYEITKIIDEVAQETGKNEDDIKRYYIAFWSHYNDIADSSKIIDKIEKGERKIHRSRDIRDIIQYKIELHMESIYRKMYPGVDEDKIPKEILEKYSPMDLLTYSWPKMEFKYAGQQKSFQYEQQEDAFLLFMMHRHGYGAKRRIQLEIRRAWQFRFNWFFKSRSPQEIQKRCDVLIRVVEKEVQEHRDKEAPKVEEEQPQLKEAQDSMYVKEQPSMQASVQPLPPQAVIIN